MEWLAKTICFYQKKKEDRRYLEVKGKWKEGDPRNKNGASDYVGGAYDPFGK